MTHETAMPVPGWFLDPILHLPPWLGYLFIGILLTYTIGLAGFVVARTGRSPLWSLVLLVPVLGIVALWVFAYAKWPRYEQAARDGRQPPS